MTRSRNARAQWAHGIETGQPLAVLAAAWTRRVIVTPRNPSAWHLHWAAANAAAQQQHGDSAPFRAPGP